MSGPSVWNMDLNGIINICKYMIDKVINSLVLMILIGKTRKTTQNLETILKKTRGGGSYLIRFLPSAVSDACDESSYSKA